MRGRIDIAFDFRSDTPPGRDPDVFSPTLRRYHKFLWSKPLPNGADFTLDDSGSNYLYHRSGLGEFFLSSDAVIPTFKWASHIKELIPDEELQAFNAVGYTIGGMMVFPGNQIDGKWTINQVRGCYGQIRDRFDLTLECIRRHYCGETSPLSVVLARYADFFGLFGDFRGYVEFFLLQDAVAVDREAVIFSAPFEDFTTSPIPKTLDEYREYRHRAITFIEARNRRIQSTEGLAPSP